MTGTATTISDRAETTCWSGLEAEWRYRELRDSLLRTADEFGALSGEQREACFARHAEDAAEFQRLGDYRRPTSLRPRGETLRGEALRDEVLELFAV